jgi:hypothetical protein
MRRSAAVLASLAAIVVLGLGSAGGAAATSATADVTDIWWNPGESGWGMQLVSTGTFVFATVYVYGADGKPTWVTGELTAGADATFSGPLYVTSGPWFGGAWNPALVGGRQAGTMTFVLTSPTAGRLAYSVDGVAVDKLVQRQPLTFDDYNGTYSAWQALDATGCTNPANDHARSLAVVPVSIAQNGTAMSIVVRYPFGGIVTCTHTGAYTQLGRAGQFTGSYACTDGDSGTSQFLEMNNRPGMMSARIAMHSTTLGCASAGDITGLR